MFTDAEIIEARDIRRLASGHMVDCMDMEAIDVLLEIESPLSDEDIYELLEAGCEMDEFVSEMLFDGEY